MSTVGQEDLESYLPPFGLSSFRPGQREVIETILGGRDCLCVMPTGGGKSLCYQLPAIARGGLTLVVSPLIALMKDQVDALAKRGLPATFINSTLSADELSARLARMAAGEFRLVYVVPERFRSNRFVDAVRRSDLRMLAIDEAHCISEWGHDFRKDYARLGYFRSLLGEPRTIALTATATPIVRDDIVKLLALNDPAVFITGFSRPNLHYHVRACSSDREKDEALFGFLGDTPGSGIVYASTRKRCEELGERIASRTGRPTTVYHAGLMADDRRAAQDDFMLGRTEIAVATLAFGMGIDKADVRFVVHYNLPGSLEAYYQEAGRAGRDGKRSDCLLLFGMGDRNIHQFFIESAYPSREVVAQVHRFLCGLETNPIELTQQEVKEALNLQIGAEAIGTCEKLLESAGVIERLEAAENTAAVRLSSDLPTLVDLLPQQAKVKRQVLRAVEQWVGSQRNEWCYLQPRELLARLPGYMLSDLTKHLRELTSLSAFDYVPPFRGRAIHVNDRVRRFEDLQIDFDALETRKNSEYEKLERVLRFARHRGCREQEILTYFGQHDSEACGRCDNCAKSGPSTRPGAASSATTDGLVEAVRMVLSGVARVSRSRSGCGKQLLAQMLCGSAAKGVTRNRLDKLSTFGLLAHAKQTDVVQLIDALLICGLLEQTELEPFRPVLALTDRGSEIMNGGRDLLPTLPIAHDIARRLVPPQQRGSKAGKPATNLEQVSAPVAGPPQSQPSHELEANRLPSAAPVVDQPPVESLGDEVSAEAQVEQPTHYWSWRLLSAGFTPHECAAIRALDPEVVLDHALRAADAGLPIQANWFLSEEQIEQIDALIGSQSVGRIRPLLERLPRGTRYEAVQLVLKARGRACPA
jgi:ATP-dependent DNA helicase RecQ